MNLILPSEVPFLPTDLIIGWNNIESYQKTGVPFLDEQFLAKNPNQNRRDEHYSARKLFGNLLDYMDLPSKSVELKKMDLGKPYGLVGEDMLFTSFSHCRDWVVCAMSLKVDIGVDCEPLDRKLNPLIFDRILTESEKELLNELHPLAIWAMKEAFVKCIGTGIRTSLQKYQLRKKGDLFYVDWENEEISIVPFVKENHQLAVAWKQ